MIVGKERDALLNGIDGIGSNGDFLGSATAVVIGGESSANGRAATSEQGSLSAPYLLQRSR